MSNVISIQTVKSVAKSAPHNCIMYTLKGGLAICSVCGSVKPRRTKPAQKISNPVVAHWFYDYRVAS